MPVKRAQIFYIHPFESNIYDWNKKIWKRVNIFSTVNNDDIKCGATMWVYSIEIRKSANKQPRKID